jgi:hypothetical protein
MFGSWGTSREGRGLHGKVLSTYSVVEIVEIESRGSVFEINEWYCFSKNSCGIKTRKNTSVYATKNSLKPLEKKKEKVIAHFDYCLIGN